MSPERVIIRYQATDNQAIERVYNTYKDKRDYLISKNGFKKQWSPKNFSKLSQLINKIDLDVVIAGTPNDRDIIKDITKLSPKIIRLDEFYDFPNFINLCDYASIIISVDTDIFFLPDEDYETTSILKSNKISVNNHIIKSIHGHDAFLIETNQISDIFTKILK
jgi:hypothetical protein